MNKRWKTFNSLTPEEDAIPVEINHKGKVLTSAKEIAASYAQFLDEKTEKIRSEGSFTNFKALRIFRKVVKRVEDDVVFPPVTIKEVKTIIRGLKSTNSRGNTDITNRIVKTFMNIRGKPTGKSKPS